jgi:hypothetical protein
MTIQLGKLEAENGFLQKDNSRLRDDI